MRQRHSIASNCLLSISPRSLDIYLLCLCNAISNPGSRNAGYMNHKSQSPGYWEHCSLVWGKGMILISELSYSCYIWLWLFCYSFFFFAIHLWIIVKSSVYCVVLYPTFSVIPLTFIRWPKNLLVSLWWLQVFAWRFFQGNNVKSFCDILLEAHDCRHHNKYQEAIFSNF